MRDFFAAAAARLLAATAADPIVPKHAESVAAVTAVPAGMHSALAGLTRGRNAPTGHAMDGVTAERTLSNLRDAARQLGIRFFADAAADAAAAAAAGDGRAGGRGKGAAPADSDFARLVGELQRAEAAWSAADCAGTARAVVAAVSATAQAGGGFRPLSAALRFHRAPPAGRARAR
jgi:hypothetical protein